MFLGSLPQPLRAIIAEHALSWPADQDVYVACSGNFTIERTLAPTGRRLHGNDVQLYTCAIGWWLSGRTPVPVDVKPDREDLEWLRPYLDGGPGTVATLLLCTRLLPAIDRPGNAYFDRMATAYREQWTRLYDSTVAKLAKLTVRLESFYAGDAGEWLMSEVPRDGIVASFPPFDTGGYETMFAALHEAFDWPAPEYEVLDEEGVAALIETITDRPHWITGTNVPHPELGSYLRGTVQETARARTIYVYSSERGARVVRPSQKTEPVLNPCLGPGDEIGERLQIAELRLPQFATLRSRFLDPKIAPAQPMNAYAVLVDGLLVGAFAVGAPKFDRYSAYLLSDFAVAPTGYPRLSKLVLTAALSTEAQALMQRAASRRIRTVNTTAFTNKPVSMKYRGLFDLASRKPSPYPEFTTMLNYTSAAGRWTLAEGLEQWKTRHGQRSAA
jgi:hypothetical protein